MGAARSCEFDQLALLQIGQGFAHIGSKRGQVSIVLFCQRLHNFDQRAPITTGKNFVRGVVQFDDAFGKKQNAFASSRVVL